MIIKKNIFILSTNIHDTTVFCLFLVFLLFHTPLNAQLSPGKLFSGHAQLEGLSNCTQCHILGQKVSNEKCLDCHKEIQSLINANRGYHVSREVKKKDCAACHSEHHGRKFRIIHFDKDRFDHDLAGYTLKGAHKKIDDCKKCHQPKFIRDRELKKDPDTYLGLGTQCLLCHEDYHKNTLSDKCLDCHNMENFKIKDFNHDKTDYPLVGLHQKVDCKKCHEITQTAEKKFQKFKDVAYKQCTDCHKDPHDRKLGKSCNACHNVYGFKWKIVRKKYNHNRTKYPLKGKHRRLSCTQCHKPDIGIKRLFSDYKQAPDYDCDLCHEDKHEGRFGDRCSKCHTETSFAKIEGLSGFDHNVTSFPLIGQHMQVDCKKCHTSDKMTDPLEHNACTDCHKDEHNGELVNLTTQKIIDCKSCHTESGFTPSTYTIEQHNQTKFKLEGGHLATPCFMCHVKKGETWHFKDIGSACIDCHDNIHRGALDDKFLASQSCENCHSISSWYEMVAFNHQNTDYPLIGKHQSVQCAQCHKPSKDKKVMVVFKGLEKACKACHDDHHRGQFDAFNQSECTDCHTPDSWEKSIFNHDLARFKLDGQHKNVTCDKCHFPSSNGDKASIIYRNNKLKCIDCHL